MKHYSNKLLALLMLVAVLLNGCSSDDPEVERVESPSTLVTAESQIEWSKGDLQGFIQQAGIDMDLDAIKHNVTIYHVTYNTTYKGISII